MKIRTTCPKNNKYYIRKAQGGLSDAVLGKPTISGANVLCNCVGYAGSRFNEIINDPDLKGVVKKFKYQLVCNAENFIESAKKRGLKISDTPIEGGIMVWQKGATLNDSDGAGHVAVVERVYDDGSILTSESGWASWAFKTVRRDNTNGRWGQNEYYKFRGCIINPSITNPKVVPTPKLDVDGVGGNCTVRAMQKYFGTPQDGVISGQNKSLNKYYPSITAVEYGKGGSAVIKALQKWLKVTQDGVLGENTVKAWQKKIGVTADGVFGKASMKAWQTYLNDKLFGDNSQTAEPPKPVIDYRIIDISNFQDTIDFAKAKADGIKGVIVKCGYRGAESGGLYEDSRFIEHIRGAYNAGLAVGIYMFTEGITAEEGKEEADYAIKMWKKAGVPISYPIAVDTENVFYYDDNGKRQPGRANSLTKAKRTEVINAFCEEIKAKGYEPMIYASTSWLNSKLNMSKLPYKVWVAQYASICEYSGDYIIWQYTSEAKVDGIKGNVDMNHCYVNPKEVACPKVPKTVDELAQEVLDDKWGRDDDRKQRLEDEGYDYYAVQKRVNEIIESRKTIADKFLEACEAQAEWMKDSTYGWESYPTIEKSKKKGTCVTYIACALQRIGILPSGKYIWHNKKGKVIGANDKMEIIYPNGKTLRQLKDELKAGDIIMDGVKTDVESGSHIFTFTGKWDGEKPIIWDNHSAQKKGGKSYAYTRNRNVIAIARLKEMSE